MATDSDIHDCSLSGSEFSELDTSLSDDSIVDVTMAVREDGQEMIERVMVSAQEVEGAAVGRENGSRQSCSSLGGGGYMSLFMATLDRIKDEEHVKMSECAPTMLELISSLKDCSDTTCDLVVTLCSRVKSCVDAGGRCQLPSAIAGKMWAAFHKLRLDPKLRQLWEAQVSVMDVSAGAKKTSILVLQIVLDRLLKQMVTMKKEEVDRLPQPLPARTLTVVEKNVVRYMAGYTAFKLLKQYKKKSPHPAVQHKRQMFVAVLKGMKADRTDQDDCEDCTSEWTELIDRGGLFHVHSQAYQVMELLEYKVRRHLCSTAVQPEQDHQAALIQDIVTDRQILEGWEKIAWKIPTSYEVYSLELLKEVARVWTNIRCHSFAKCYSMQNKSQFSKHGTRKTLKSKGTDKETD